MHQATDIGTSTDPWQVSTKFALLARQPCPPDLMNRLGWAIIKDVDPVDLFFGALPSPEEYERAFTGNVDAKSVHRKYETALNSFRHLTNVQCRDELRARHGGVILENLFRLLDRVDGVPPRRHRHFVKRWMFGEILAAVCHIRPGVDSLALRSRYDAATCRIVEYLSWEARGRKDSDCFIRKPWDYCHTPPEALRRAAPRELSRLPLVGLSTGGHADADANETRRLYRLAQLFQVAFLEFVLSNHGPLKTLSGLHEADGIVRASAGYLTSIPGPAAHDDAGAHTQMDLSQPHANAVLYAFWCCAPQREARALLEYFFRCKYTVYYIHLATHPPLPTSLRSLRQ
jgi:hypothetical protein